MQHQNTVFHSLLKHVPWHVFDRLVDVHGADARVRRLSMKDQFVALLYGQLSGASSLREIVAGLSSHASRLYHLGARPAQRSTLSDANAARPAALFADLLAQMIARSHRGLRRKIAETTYLIDSTGLRLSGLSAGWAKFAQATQKSVKSPLAFARLVRANLMHRRPINGLLEPPISVPTNKNQRSLEFA